MAKYREWTTSEGLLLLRGWARDGHNLEQIARNMGVNVATLRRWRHKYGEIGQAVRRGKEAADYEVEEALLRTAVAGNTTAQIYWLKNRRPDKWRDKREDGTAHKDVLNRLDEVLHGIDRRIKDD